MLNSNGNVTTTTADYPHEVTTGGKAVIAVKLDANGKANLVLSGKDASVTPIVYEGTVLAGQDGDQATEYNAEYSARALQAKASKVTFELKHSLGLKLEALGNKEAAKYLNSKETGGRDYKVTYTDKDGKPVSVDSKVKVAIDKAGIKGNFYLLDSDGNSLPGQTINGKIYYEVSVNKDGQATFTVAGDTANDYVTPVVFVDNGATKNELDKNDLQATSDITYFVEKVTYSAQLVALGADGKPVKSALADGNDYIEFVYKLVDQNGKPRRASDATSVTFNVSAGAGTLVLPDGTEIAPDGKESITKTISTSDTEASVRIKAKEGSTAYVTAVGSRAGVVLPTTDPASLTGTFTSKGELVDGKAYSGLVTDVDKANHKVTLEINGKKHTLSYTDSSLYISGVVATLPNFEAELNIGDTVQYVPGKTPYFDITNNVAPDTTAPVLSSAKYQASKAAVPGAKAGVTIQGIKFTATQVGTDGNDVTIKLVDTDTTNTTASIAYDSIGKVLVVDLAGETPAGGTYAITDTLNTVITAVNAKKAVTGIEAVLDNGATGTTLATVSSGTDKTAGGVNAEAAINNSTLVLTFDEAIANTSSVNVQVTGKTLGTNPVYSWDNDKKVLTITLGAGADVAVGDVISSTGAKDASGNIQSGNVTIQ
ncbi:hypothetical protein P9D39_16300 [Heyndrickxia oleronia]|uniref:Uncharacterized protein n=1 Tax=Heyndrickxia oleronia TaxID=38875 RepID=A0A8E2I6N9_9BACI|nr:hypothetical protein [Heyndrickxia oleronia]MEC1375853.1 hypothetical protein [Heyndrickxia oleronia]OOP67706.1 hypothetical protein BWZ43_14320 [Heyndrickxia oleronia]QQZ05570.1 hypothetical protein I5818_03480 [Heyndrickxia oleronia]